MNGHPFDRRAFLAAVGASGLGWPQLAGEGGLHGGQIARPLIIVGAAPLAAPSRGAAAAREAIEAARSAGVSALIVPVFEGEHRSEAIEAVLQWRRAAAELGTKAAIAESWADLETANQHGRVALVGHAHGFQWVGRDLSFLGDIRAGGIRISKLSSGWRNLAADGAFEATDLGLTRFGRRAVPAVGRSGLVLDLTGTGRRSSLEAMELAGLPVVFTHGNANTIQAHALNLTDDQIRACAAGGGVIGISAFPTQVGSLASTADDVVRHLDHVAKVAGIAHVGLGLDFDVRRTRRYQTDPWPDPPYRYPAGLGRPGDLAAFGALLARRGYGPDARAAILGGNFARVLRKVWSGENR